MVTVDPVRLLDTRPDGTTIDGQHQATGKIPAGHTTRIQITNRANIPTGTTGVEVNLTAIDNQARGYATIHPCTTTPPTTSTINYTPGINIANATTVALDPTGHLCIYSHTTTHYALDILAYLPANTDDHATDHRTADGDVARRRGLRHR